MTTAFVLIAASAVGVSSAPADTAPPGDIPDNQAFVTFRGSGYSLKTPEGWGRTRHGSTVTLTDKFNSIRVELARAPQPPSVASAKRGDVARLKATAKNFQLRSVARVARAAGPAVLIIYRAASPPDSVTGKTLLQDVERYTFWKAGRAATITLAAPRGSDNVDAWRLVTNSFRWLP